MLNVYRNGLRGVASLLTASLLLVLNACEDRLSPDPSILPDAPIYALNDANQLLRLTIQGPSLSLTTMPLVGTNSLIGEQIMSIDFRPATGQLYGLSNKSRLFIIDPTTAQASPLSENPFSPGITSGVMGIDFNPTLDRIRLVSHDGQDLWLHPETGSVVAKNRTMSGIMGIMVSEIAYTNNQAGAATSTLYHIDPATDRLYTQTSSGNGKLTDVGPLGLDIAGAAGFDITPDNNGLVAVTFNGSSELQKINLLTGRLQKLTNLPGTIIGLAVPTEPVTYAIDNVNNLLTFNPASPQPVIKSVSGLQAGEYIEQISFRPATGQLFALGSTNRLYTLNTANGMAAVFTKEPLSQLPSGKLTDFRFHPALDRIRLTFNTGERMMLNPANGRIITDESELSLPARNRTQPSYTLLRTNDSTRVYTTNSMNGAASTGVLLPGNPVIRSFTTGPGF